MNKHCIEGREPLNNLKHYLKIMRIALSFLFFCILFSSASNSYSQKFTIKSNFLYTFTDLKIISPTILEKLLNNEKSVETNAPLRFIQSKKENRNIVIEIVNSHLKSFFHRKRINFFKLEAK